MPDLPPGTVTFLLTDIVGSSALWEQHPATMRQALEQHDRLVDSIVASHHGHLVRPRGEGDSRFAVFARATDAVAAAGALQQAMYAEPWPTPAPLWLRIALQTGEGEVWEGDYSGNAVNRCARLRALAHGGQILVSAATHEVVRDQLPPGLQLRELGLHRLDELQRPEQVFQLLVPQLPSEFPSLPTVDRHPTNFVPQPTSFIGREHEIAAVRQRLLDPSVRLLTLTGPGGTGKTRLALEVAAGLLDQFADGIFAVNLAPISDPALVPLAIAQTLGVKESSTQPPGESLTYALRHKQLLLLLDNFEQVVAAAMFVSELLSAAPQLKVLVTSRAPLHLRGEHEFPVPPMAAPNPDQLPELAAFSQYEAVALFIQRAVAVQPSFQVTNANAQAVAEICNRLDGLPLAIELAAARIKVLAPQALLSRLSSRLTLLTGGARDLPVRHQTLRNTVEWSYQLLTTAEQQLFRHLSVFVSGCTVEAVEAVCPVAVVPPSPRQEDAAAAQELGVLNGVQSLLDKSLLRQVDGADGEVRMTMLEMIREYALEQAAANGETEALHARHAMYYLGVVEQAEAGWSSSSQQSWVERVEAEHDNLRAALQWAMTKGQPDLGLRLATALWPFWDMRGYIKEARTWLERGLTLSSTTAGSVRAKALNHAGYLALFQADYGTANAFLEENLKVYRELGDPEGIARTLTNLGYVAVLGQQNVARIPFLLAEAMALRPEVNNHHTIASLLGFAGYVASTQGKFEEAVRWWEEGLIIYRDIRDAQGEGMGLASLGMLALARPDLDQAARRLRESLQVLRESGDKLCLQYGLVGLAGIAARTNEPVRAARLWGAAEALHDVTGIVLLPLMRSQINYDGDIAMARAHIGEEAFAAAWGAGKALPLEEAVAYALEQRPEPVAARSRPTPPSPDTRPAAPHPTDHTDLTERETEVLRLLAKGLTYDQIATDLIISRHTVNRHVTSIYTKLGVTSRHAAGRWATAHGLA